MKKYILFCFVCFCLNKPCYGQLYLKGYTGYSLSAGNNEITSLKVTNDELLYESSYRLKLGQGVNLGLSIGYEFNKNIAFEITGNTQLFSKFNYSKSYYQDELDDSETIYGSGIGGFFGDLEYSGVMFQVSPQIVFRSNPYNQWIFYVKGGPDFIRVTHKRTIRESSIKPFDYSNHTYLYTLKYSGNINTGIQCSVGTEYELSKNIHLFAELTAVNARYTFTKRELLRYETDGIDILSELELTSFEDLDDKVIFNHAGLNVGLKYIFR